MVFRFQRSLVLISIFSFSIFIAAMFSSCSIPVEPLNKFKYSVFSILLTSSSSQTVKINSANFGKSQGVSGAIVEINGVRLNEDTLWRGIYTVDSIGFVKPGKVYELKIIVGDYLISGETIVPDSFEIIEPVNKYVEIKAVEGDTVHINLKWSKGTGVGLYIIEVLSPPVCFQYPDTVICGRGKIKEFFTYDEWANIDINVKRYGDYIVRIYATDDNYANYVSSKYRFPSVGVENSYGLFASMSVDSVVVKITK